MANNVMQEIGIVMGTWYVDFNGARSGLLLGVLGLLLREPPRQRRQKFFLLPLEHCIGFPRTGEDDAVK